MSNTESNALPPNDYVFLGEKALEIPILDINLQAPYIIPPFKIWGQLTRRQKFTGTWCFYTKDYKFSALWKHPDALIKTKSPVAVETNFSTSKELPLALGIYDIYRKRWVSKYWQLNGVRIIVDVNVSEKFLKHNFLGIPDGWRSYASRAQKGNNEFLHLQYEYCKKKAGNQEIFFLVYGGGTQIQIMCQENNWFWIPEQMQPFKKKEING